MFIMINTSFHICIQCVTRLEKTGIIYTKSPVHILAFISYSVYCAIYTKSVSFIIFPTYTCNEIFVTILSKDKMLLHFKLSN